ncbi:MAG: DNA-deoxyinosine glycosylase [Elusimicrobia bacterium]|nr:DNA-deoxyinosine glycosylase [Elusimicrobiota bacterium]
MKLQKKSFPPIVGGKPQTLILGTFPGNESLAANQYYANKRNAFWFIMGKLLNMKSDASYKLKKELLKENGLALWDVFKSCERNGSLDSSIKTKTIQMNDFKSFFTAYPSIKFIFFNGKKAQDEYVKRVLPLLLFCRYYLTLSLKILNIKFFLPQVPRWQG